MSLLFVLRHATRLSCCQHKIVLVVVDVRCPSLFIAVEHHYYYYTTTSGVPIFSNVLLQNRNEISCIQKIDFFFCIGLYEFIHWT